MMTVNTQDTDTQQLSWYFQFIRENDIALLKSKYILACVSFIMVGSGNQHTKVNTMLHTYKLEVFTVLAHVKQNLIDAKYFRK